MPALISALVFFLFAGIIANPAPTTPGQDFIPGTQPGGRIDCIPADASSQSPSLFKIPKPTKDNVSFVNKPPCFENTSPEIINAVDYNCKTSPWDPKHTPSPDIADYVSVAANVTITDIWPAADTTRLAKQILPAKTENDRQLYDPIRDQIYRATCNDWCLFTPPNRTPPLPYGGTFFCDFVFMYQGQKTGNGVGDRKYIEREGQKYPDDSHCNSDTYEDCPVFEIFIRKDAPVPEVAGGAAPGAQVTPLRCDLVNATPTPAQTEASAAAANLAAGWIETVQAQTETFINLVGNHEAAGEWIYKPPPQTTFAYKVLPEAPNGREKIPEPQPIAFRGKTYEAFFNLTAGLLRNKNILYLVEILPDGTHLIEQADAARANNDITFELPYLEFRRSPDIHPKGKTLQLGTFPVVTAKGWWELFPKESKPAIYLYPEAPTALNIKLDTTGKLTVSDPPYNPATGWNILAYPNGSLLNLGTAATNFNNQNPMDFSFYPYLYYEAVLDRVHIKPTGFLVRGAKLRSYFKRTLPQLGLNRKETADFIDYWLARLSEDQPYYFIHYLSAEEIEQLEPLSLRKLADSQILLTPTTQIRIRPYFKPLSAKEARRLQLQIVPQQLPTPPSRQGFTLVEWGGILAPTD